MNKIAIGERAETQTEKFAVYQKQDGAFCALSTNEAIKLHLVKVSEEFRSYGRAIVEKQKLERRAVDGGANA